MTHIGLLPSPTAHTVYIDQCEVFKFLQHHYTLSFHTHYAPLSLYFEAWCRQVFYTLWLRKGTDQLGFLANVNHGVGLSLRGLCFVCLHSTGFSHLRGQP